MSSDSEPNNEIDAAVGARSVREGIVWRWQQVGVGCVLMAVFAITVVPTRFVDKTSPVIRDWLSRIPAIQKTSPTTSIEHQLTRVSLANQLWIAAARQEQSIETHDQLKKVFDELLENEAGKRIASSESFLLRYRVLRDHLLSPTFSERSLQEAINEARKCMEQSSCSLNELNSSARKLEVATAEFSRRIEKSKAGLFAIETLVAEARSGVPNAQTLKEVDLNYEAWSARQRNSVVQKAVEDKIAEIRAAKDDLSKRVKDIEETNRELKR